MKRMLFVLAVVLLAVSALATNEKPSATDTNLTPEQIEANYTRAIEGRTADILKVLALSDPNQAAKVHDLILAQYRALRAWHDANDPKLKAAKGDTNAVAQIRSSSFHVASDCMALKQKTRTARSSIPKTPNNAACP